MPISNATIRREGNTQDEWEWTPKATITIPYIAGVSEDIRRVCKSFDVRLAFKTARTICSKITEVKDPLPMEKQSMVVYQLPCSCGHTPRVQTEGTQRCL